MNVEDLRKKTEKELQALVRTLKEKGQDLSYQRAEEKIKNEREIRATRKRVAQIQTVLQKKKR